MSSSDLLAYYLCSHSSVVIFVPFVMILKSEEDLGHNVLKDVQNNRADKFTNTSSFKILGLQTFGNCISVCINHHKGKGKRLCDNIRRLLEVNRTKFQITSLDCDLLTRGKGYVCVVEKGEEE